MSRNAKILSGIGLVIVFFWIGFFVAFLYSKTEEYSAPEPDPSVSIIPRSYQTTILAVGDVMLGRNVELLMDTNGDEYPFLYISDLFSKNDTVLANLEGPVVTDHVRTPSGELKFTFDKRIPDLLKKHNVGLVSLANNHTFDQGVSGYNETRTLVKAAGIEPIGHPFDYSNKYIVRKTINHQNFMFVGFNITNPNFDFEDALSFIKTVDHSPSEFSIAVIHGGEEYKLVSNADQQRFYRGLIDEGVDSVIAHHPHVVQEVEKYKDKFIFYSLGNFIFDQYFSKDVEQGLAVRLTFNSKGDTKPQVLYELIPIQSKKSQPMVMEEAAKTAFLKNLALKSSESLKEEIEKGYIDKKSHNQ